MVKREQFEALILAALPQIQNYLPSEDGSFRPDIFVHSDGNYVYSFQWVDSGDGVVEVIFSDAQGDQSQWDTDIRAGMSDSWSPFDTAVATMYAVMIAEKLHKAAFPESLFTDNGAIL